MNRRHSYRTFPIKVDVIYKSWYVSKLINCIMKCGKKAKAIRIVYSVLKMFEAENSDCDVNSLLIDVVNKLKPSVYLRSRRIASKVYRVPVAISDIRATKRAINWLIRGAASRSERTMVNRLFYEMKAVLESNKSEAVKIRDNYHKVAKDNEAFVHYV